MKQILSFLILVVVTGFFSSCATTEQNVNAKPAPTATTAVENATNTEQVIRKLHQAYERAWVQQDAATFERLLADDVTQTDGQGKVLSKAEIISNAKSGAVKFESGTSEDLKIRVYGDTVILTELWKENSMNNGIKTVASMRNTVVYLKKNENWQVVSDQVTVIVPKK